MGQIWGYSKCENMKSEVPFQIVGNYGDFFQKHGICDRIHYFENIFSKMAKTHYQERGEKKTGIHPHAIYKQHNFHEPGLRFTYLKLEHGQVLYVMKSPSRK